MKAAIQFAAAIALTLTLALGGGSAHASAAAWEVTDDAGNRLSLATPAQRIVSLAPGATAMLFAAGAGARVVGTANYSDEPAAARAIPRIGDSEGFDLERILALRPDVVVVWGTGTNQASIDRLQRRGLRVYRHQVLLLADLPDSIRRLGQLAGTAEQAEQSAQQISVRIAALRSTNLRSVSLPTVLVQVWDRPVYTVGGRHLLSDVLDYCGYANAFADLTDAGPAVSVEAVVSRNPAVIVAVAPSSAAGRAWLEGWRAFPAMRAVQGRRLLVSVDQRFSRLGPTVIDAAEQWCRELDDSARH